MEPAKPDHEISTREQCKEAVQEMSDENDSEQTETLRNQARNCGSAPKGMQKNFTESQRKCEAFL